MRACEDTPKRLGQIEDELAGRLRPLVCSRRNYLCAGSDGGGESAAMTYCLIGTACLNGIEPFAYLRTAFERIAGRSNTRIDELPPWRLMLAQHVEQQAA
ncbi:hypothetical protein DID99_35375 [Burkholderia sp. Bp8986]|nr:hypothetical protein DID99_35375 [Burkholderia sp. Bp8986]